MATILPNHYAGLNQIAPQVFPPPAGGIGYLWPTGMPLAAWTPRAEFPSRSARSKMVAKAVLIAAALLALAPAVATAFWPASPDQPTLRAVDLKGPIQGFTQSRDRIQVRLIAEKAGQAKIERKQITVRDTDGDTLAIPLKDGQTWATAQLPANIANATKLEISVE